MSFENEPGIELYDLRRWRIATIHFSSPVLPQQFIPDGARLFVLTANQTAYILNLNPAAKTAQSP